MQPNTDFLIKDLQAEEPEHCQVAVELLYTESIMHWPESWPTLDSAKKELQELFDKQAILRCAVGGEDKLMGWIGAIRQYSGHTWKLNPLVIHPEFRMEGIGRALVSDLEEQVLLRGGENIYVHTEDEDGRTSLANTELYPNVLDKLKDLKNTAGHPFEFFREVGFQVVGVIPHANGYGRPDIIMAKRLRRR